MQFLALGELMTLSKKLPRALIGALLVFSLPILPGCSRSENSTTDTGSVASPLTPQTISPGNQISVTQIGAKYYFKVEGTLSDKSFSRLTSKKLIRQREFDAIFKKLREIDANYFSLNKETAYFTFQLPYPNFLKPIDSSKGSIEASSVIVRELMAPLKALKFRHHLIFNPIISDLSSVSQIKAFRPQTEGLIPLSSGTRGGSRNFSGLSRIHAPEFVTLAEKEIGGGIKVNGDSVNLGITDTGITYNHPTFLSSDRSHNRITYMKDFTREGRIYFNLNAKFKAQDTDLTPETVVVTAEIIATPKLPALPAGDQLVELKDLQLKVSPEIRKILLDPESHAKLGVFSEKLFSTPNEKIDINGDGATEDDIPMILIPGKTPAQDILYVDISGNGDFRNVKPMTDWNTSKTTQTAYAEQIGYEIQDDKLPSFDGKSEVRVRSVSILGFDPGNHGTHVAGIAAGSRTIANDDPSTLARGVAPDSKILMNRICANNAGCNATEAIIDLALKGNAQVINMSIGGLDAFNDGYGVQETIINRLTLLKNVLFVVSAGNSGPGKQTVGSPSTARLALSVGASASYGLIQRQYQWPGSKLIRTPEEDEDFMLFFSGRGPSAAGGFKPNLVAPGTELSAIRLNSAPGNRAGMDVYWGTSMSAPTVTGAYALFLDAIKKYNLQHPELALPTQATILRRILMETAHPFDVRSFDPETQVKTEGQYTWVDQGTGMLDLTSAWKKLAELRDHEVPSAISFRGAPVDLDYSVMIPTKTPNGNSYDGSTPSLGDPTFGTGLYVDYYGTDTLRPVYVSRQLPFKLKEIPEAGSLVRDLETTADEFVLRTKIYGSDRPWIKAGVLDQLQGDPDAQVDCNSLETANLTLLSRGVDVQTDEEGSSTLFPFPASALNICIDRNTIRNELSPGDHGALISAYRVVSGKVSPVPSFWIPVYVQVPHQTLAGSNGYQIQSSVKSFGLSRNYVNIPKGTSLVQVTLEVPALKLGQNGLPLSNEKCSGVELMALQGNNTDSLIPNRKNARVSNCNSLGKPIEEPEKRRIVVTQVNPRPGTWDLHVFGQYKYSNSKYNLKMDYLSSNSNLKEIVGRRAALNGALEWNIQESSLSMIPDHSKTSFILNGLLAKTNSKLTKGAMAVIPSPQGEVRTYPAETKSVTITTGGSPGNDIDLSVIECPPSAAESHSLTNCIEAGRSGGATDEESVTFTPKKEKVYLAAARGYDIKDAGEFSSTEKIEFAPEKGSISIEGISPQFKVKYGLSEDQIAKSHLLNHELFTSGKYEVTGNLTLRTLNEIPLYAVPVRIKN